VDAAHFHVFECPKLASAFSAFNIKVILTKSLVFFANRISYFINSTNPFDVTFFFLLGTRKECNVEYAPYQRPPRMHLFPDESVDVIG